MRCPNKAPQKSKIFGDPGSGMTERGAGEMTKGNGLSYC